MSYNSIIKTISIILISILCFSCNQKELQNHNEIFFIDLVKDQIRENDEIIHGILNAKRPSSELFSEMIHLQELRDKALEQLLLSDFENADTISIAEYINRLKEPIKIEDYYSVSELKKDIVEKAKNIKYNHTKQSKTQKITWAYHCVELEERILNLYSIQCSGAGCGWTSCDYFSKKDSIKLGEKYELVILPMIARKKVEYLHNDFTFLLNGEDIKIDYEFEEIEKIGLLYFTPPQKGSYTIKGTYTIDTTTVKIDKATLEGRFRDNISQTFKVE